jgi:hypothetical protein
LKFRQYSLSLYGLCLKVLISTICSLQRHRWTHLPSRAYQIHFSIHFRPKKYLEFSHFNDSHRVSRSKKIKSKVNRTTYTNCRDDVSPPNLKLSITFKYKTSSRISEFEHTYGNFLPIEVGVLGDHICTIAADYPDSASHLTRTQRTSGS